MTAQLFMFPDHRPADNRLPAAEQLTFELWWRQYPHKVCKGQARKAWIAAIRKATHQQLMDGVERYMAHKPPDIPWCNPATWLNGERWQDEPAHGAANSRTTSQDERELSLIRKRAGVIAAGLPCAAMTRRQAAVAIEQGWLSKEQACKAGLM